MLVTVGSISCLVAGILLLGLSLTIWGIILGILLLGGAWYLALWSGVMMGKEKWEDKAR